jgi:hypothetical protein
MNRTATVGAIMMLIGIVMFLPGVQVTSSQLWAYMLIPAAALLTYGTYKVGISEPGRAV